MSGLPIDILKEYGIAVFLSACVCVFLWYLIKLLGNLLKQLTTQISNERERWEKIVDNHLTELNASQKDIATSLTQTSLTLTNLSTAHGNHDEQCSKNNLKITENLTESSRILKSIDEAHTLHDSRQTVDHSQSATEHAVIMERLPKSRNGYKPRKKRK